MNSSKLRAVELTGDKEELTTEFKAKFARSCTTGVHKLRTQQLVHVIVDY